MLSVLTNNLSKIRGLFSGLPAVASVALVALLYLSGNLNFIEQKIQDERFRYIQRDATSDTVLISIDSFSLKEVGVWPWPRRIHGHLLDNLVKAGANRVAFNLDFSSNSNIEDDRLFSEALQRAAGKVVMIAFQQHQRVGKANIFSTNAPIDSFAQHAVTVAANIRPDMDGIIRRYTIFQDIGDKKVLTLPAVLANSRGITNSVFSIDFGIRPSSIPIIPYSDILFNRIDPKILKGKNILIGATAIELGNHLAVPIYQALPSSIVLVEAIESLSQNRAIAQIHPLAVLFLMLMLGIFIGRKFKNWTWQKGILILALSLSSLVAASTFLYALAPVSIDLTPLLAVLIVSALVGWTQQIDIQTLAAFRSSMALKNQDEFVRSIIDNTFDGIFVFTANGNIEFFNDTAKKLFGYEKEEISGKNISYIIGNKRSENKKNISPIDPAYFKAGETETLGIKNDGLTFPIELSISKIETPISTHKLERRRVPRISYLCTVRDISERKLEEAEFNDRHTVMTDNSRIISMSEMASGLAHEINQPLTAIFGYLEGVRRRLVNISIVPENIIESIEKALKQADRTREILRRTRSATQKIELNRSPINLNSVAEEVVDLLKFDISRYGASVHLDLQPDLPLVEIDEIQIQQVLINLARNGMEAMAELPTLSRYLIIQTRHNEDDQVEVSVKDNGPGFSDDIKDKIFFPFATTKKDGIGIGLSICESIIENHEGSISTEKQQNGPMVFTFTLPKAIVDNAVPNSDEDFGALPKRITQRSD
ncbi:MAG: CHASE2 domain-containing protein [Rhodospirillaceae bacterium]|nr:CHASE2 domain-containing protein [Rhodospirillaceae bacterium]MBT7956971.1 CHASE2 domain-containing protein [Rhodospirillaceae bacterium]